MTVRELLPMEIDVDCYDDVCEELAIAFCGPMTLTEAGEQEFSEVLDYPVELNTDCAIIGIDDKEDTVWNSRLRKAKKFFHAMAGYCDNEDYKRWFVG